jgi:hypothetical protein
LYLYNIKIQTNIDQNAVKIHGKTTNFPKYFFKFFLGWASTALPSKQKQTVENSPLFTCNVNSGAAWATKKRSGGLPGGRPFLRELELPVICCWAVVLFLLCSVFSVFFLLPAFVSYFSFSSSASNGGDTVVDGGLRWHWWLQIVALLCGDGQCLLLFFLSVQRHRLLLLLHGCCSKGRKMVRS